MLSCLWKKVGKWQEAMYTLASRNSEGRLFHKVGAACIAERFISDLKMKRLRRHGSASDKRRRASWTNTVTRSDWEVSGDMQGDLNVWYFICKRKNFILNCFNCFEPLNRFRGSRFYAHLTSTWSVSVVRIMEIQAVTHFGWKWSVP